MPPTDVVVTGGFWVGDGSGLWRQLVKKVAREMTSSEHNDDAVLDYQPCCYGTCRIRFRGPARQVTTDSVVFLGGAETYGRFMHTPFPSLLEQSTGAPSVNLGCLHAGIDSFVSSPDLIDMCSQAGATVIQVLGAANMSNRFYTVHPRQNNRFLRASKRLKEIYPEVNFTEFDTTTHLLTELAHVGPDRIPLVRQEVQSAWVARMRTLLTQIEGRKILLWLSDHVPFQPGNQSTILRDPLFVDSAMLNAAAQFADDVVEVVASSGEIAEGRTQLVYSSHESTDVQEILGPIVHKRVESALRPVLRTGAPTLLDESSRIA